MRQNLSAVYKIAGNNEPIIPIMRFAAGLSGASMTRYRLICPIRGLGSGWIIYVSIFNVENRRSIRSLKNIPSLLKNAINGTDSELIRHNLLSLIALLHTLQKEYCMMVTCYGTQQGLVLWGVSQYIRPRLIHMNALLLTVM